MGKDPWSAAAGEDDWRDLVGNRVTMVVAAAAVAEEQPE